MKRSAEARYVLRPWEVFSQILERLSRRGWVSREKMFLLAERFDRRWRRWGVNFSGGMSATDYLWKFKHVTGDGLYPPANKYSGPDGYPLVYGPVCFVLHGTCSICGNPVLQRSIVDAGKDYYISARSLLDEYRLALKNDYRFYFHCKDKICGDLSGWILGYNKSCSKPGLEYLKIPPSEDRKAYLAAIYLERRVNVFVKQKKQQEALP